MKVLEVVRLYNVDLSQEQTLLKYINDNTPRYLASSIALYGACGLAGNYQPRVYVGDDESTMLLVVPDRLIQSVDGVTNFHFQSRDILVPPNFHLHLTLKGLPQDVNMAFVVTRLIDVSPVAPEEVDDRITPPVVGAVRTTIKDLNVTVRPEREVLAPIPQKSRTFTLPKK